MTSYKQPGSPYYYYDLYFEGRRYQKSTHLRNKTIAHRVECVRKAELAQRRAGILPKKQIPLFRGFAERFLHTIKVERRRNTHRNYLSCVRNLEPERLNRFANLKLEGRWQENIRASRWSASTGRSFPRIEPRQGAFSGRS